jgi:hypothetical protein
MCATAEQYVRRDKGWNCCATIDLHTPGSSRLRAPQLTCTPLDQAGSMPQLTCTPLDQAGSVPQLTCTPLDQAGSGRHRDNSVYRIVTQHRALRLRFPPYSTTHQTNLESSRLQYCSMAWTAQQSKHQQANLTCVTLEPCPACRYTTIYNRIPPSICYSQSTDNGSAMQRDKYAALQHKTVYYRLHKCNRKTGHETTKLPGKS